MPWFPRTAEEVTLAGTETGPYLIELSTGRIHLKITFFPGSVVGYVDYPEALLTRGLAHGLAERGDDVRIVEERQNERLTRTLLTQGAGASRHFHDNFRQFQYHTYEPRTGAQLLEWVTREMALIDVAVAVDGVEQELCRWIGNVTREGLIRAFLTFEPELLTDERASALDIDKYDIVLATGKPAADVPWSELSPTIAPADTTPGMREYLPAVLQPGLIDPAAAAAGFATIIEVLRR